MSYLKELHVAHSDFFSLVDVWNPEQLPSARIFDDVVMCATVGCSCFVINTGEGLILLDAMLPIDACYDNIVGAVKSAGWDINDLKMIFITHGHFDHTGVAARLKNETGAKIYFPKGDYEMWGSESNVLRTRGNIEKRGVDIPPVEADFEADVFLNDGDEVTLGHTTIKCTATPGHTKGCMTYILPVYDMGKRHMAVMPGGTLPQKTVEEITEQMRSIELLKKLADEFSIDVELSNHHPLGCGEVKMELCRRRMTHIPNPFVIGTSGIHSALDEYKKLCEVFMAQL